MKLNCVMNALHFSGLHVCDVPRRCYIQWKILFRNENLCFQMRNVPVIEILKKYPLRFNLSITVSGKHSLSFRKCQSHLLLGYLTAESIDCIEILIADWRDCFFPLNLEVLQTDLIPSSWMQIMILASLVSL